MSRNSAQYMPDMNFRYTFVGPLPVKKGVTLTVLLFTTGIRDNNFY
jgi:hypothetical protein